MIYKYDEQAKQTGALVVHSCGFDSIPADLGLLFTAQQFKTGSRVVSAESVWFLSRADKGVAGGLGTCALCSSCDF